MTIGRDTTVLPGSQLLGATTIGEGAVVGPEVTLTDCEVGDRRRGPPGRGPPRRRRAARRPSAPTPTCGPGPGSARAARSAASSRRRTRRSVTGRRSRTSRMPVTSPSARAPTSGPGRSSPTTTGWPSTTRRVGRHSFVGSNSVIVAPVDIADGSYVAAGTAMTDDVGPGQMAVARGRQRNVDGWVARARPGTATAEAAEAAAGAAAGPTAGRRHTSETGGRGAVLMTATESTHHIGDHDARPRRSSWSSRGGPTPGSPRRWRRSSAPSWSRRAPTTSPTARSTSATRSRSAAATPSSSRATPGPSTSRSWSSSS